MNSKEGLEVITADALVPVGESLEDLGVDDNVEEGEATEVESKINNEVDIFVLIFPELH